MATREYLEKRLQETREELAHLDERLEAKGDYGLGRGDPLIVRWELNLALRDRIEQRVAQLEEALERLDEGDYGICESCQQPINPERLEVLPRTTLCIACARDASQQDGQKPAMAMARTGRCDCTENRGEVKKPWEVSESGAGKRLPSTNTERD